MRLYVGGAVAAVVLAGCAHTGGARGPASTVPNAAAWKRAGLCSVLNLKHPRDPKPNAEHREVHRAMDPASGVLFFTDNPDACRIQKYGADEAPYGTVREAEGTFGCNLYGGEIVAADARIDSGLRQVFAMVDATGTFKIKTMDRQYCERQGFHVEGDPLGYGNP